MHLPDYLHRSRHGIWYYRWVLPRALRQGQPGLPKEVKKSTKTSDIRIARGIARGHHLDFISRHGLAPEMSKLPLGSSIRKFEAEFDPETGTLTKINATPEEMPAVLELVEAQRSIHKMMSEQIAAKRREHELSQQSAVTTTSLERFAPATDKFAGEGAGIILSEAFSKYAARQIRSGAWSDQTQKYTHEPSINLFRELVGNARPSPEGSATADPIIDIELASLTPSLVSTFLDEFWSFPARQGKRSAAANARELLLQGGEPQSRANVFKRLGHIKQFIAFCVESLWVDPQVLTRIERVIRSDSIRNRQRTTLERAALDGIVEDGYVSFTKEEVNKLFGPLFIPHVGGRAARYWIPLIGYCTGMRLNEICQLQPSHFIEIDGIPCIAVKPNTAKARKLGSGYEYDVPPARVKNLASIRNVPIHPWLVSLGLLDYAQSRSDSGARLMWDDLRYFPKAGFGKYPGRDFTELAIKAKVHVPKRKVFHSFRSTITQMLGNEQVDSELVDRFLGHEVQTTKQRNYGRTDNGRAFPIKRMHEILSKVRLELDVPPWAAVSSKVGVSNVRRPVGSRR